MLVHLGVLDVAYDAGETTGRVAQILEDNYGVMRVFAELHEQEIADALTKQMMGMLADAKRGAPLPYGDIMFPKIDEEFRRYLDAGEWEATSGQPTQAAIGGKSKRKIAGKYADARKSFVDTGLYQNSFRTWVTK